MTSQEIAALVLGSAVIAGLVSALVTALIGLRVKRIELKAADEKHRSEVKEARLRLAVEMARLNMEDRKFQFGEAPPNTRFVFHDSAFLVCAYQEALDGIADNKWDYELVQAAMVERLGAQSPRVDPGAVDPGRQKR